MKTLRKYGDLFIRFPVGFHLIYGVADNMFFWERMLEFETFLKGFGVPMSLAAAHLSVYAQFICGVLFIIGWKTKWASITMIINFIVAIGLVHLTDPYQNKFPAIMMLSASIFILLNGDGYFTIKLLGKKKR
ncbi:DoxX family protein [Flagellimonas sp. S174]|uniref:DoxX family protein n=1 Tax=Flagellimonas sp. S174 TaxID=3410790 RepID=UPI003BF5C1A4